MAIRQADTVSGELRVERSSDGATLKAGSSLSTWSLRRQLEVRPVRFVLLTKRHYTNKDLLLDRFGRNFHLPVELGKCGHQGLVLAADYSGRAVSSFEVSGVVFDSFQLAPRNLRFESPLKSIQEFDPDVIVANGDVHLGALGSWVSRRIGRPFVYDLYDNYEAFASARIPGVRRLHRRTMSQADLVTCVSPALADHVRGTASRVDVVGNGVDTELFFRRDRDASRRQLGVVAGELVAGYVGEISDARGIDVVLEAVRRARDSGMNLRLVLMGVNSSTLDLDQPWITYLTPAGQAQVPGVISSFDIAVWPYLADSWGRFVHPNKLGEYLACGVPVVATDLPEFRAVAPFAGLEWYLPGNPADLVQAVSRLLDERAVVSLPPELTWTYQATRLEQSLLSLTSQSDGGASESA
jgi:glycosyltransferase involved in cell wall biosynthesis